MVNWKLKAVFPFPAIGTRQVQIAPLAKLWAPRTR